MLIIIIAINFDCSDCVDWIDSQNCIWTEILSWNNSFIYPVRQWDRLPGHKTDKLNDWLRKVRRLSNMCVAINFYRSKFITNIKTESTTQLGDHQCHCFCCCCCYRQAINGFAWAEITRKAREENPCKQAKGQTNGWRIITDLASSSTRPCLCLYNGRDRHFYFLHNFIVNNSQLPWRKTNNRTIINACRRKGLQSAGNTKCYRTKRKGKCNHTSLKWLKWARRRTGKSARNCSRNCLALHRCRAIL